MTEQIWQQTFPNPGLDPGFRVDPEGRARFLVEGFLVDVVVKYADRDDSGDDVEMTASVKLADVVVATSERGGEWGESHTLRVILDDLLLDVVTSARHKVREINKHLARIDASQG